MAAAICPSFTDDDVFFNVETLVKFDLPKKPSEYLEQIYYDAIVYDKGALDLVIDIAGPDKVMFGTDQPMLGDVPKLRDIGTRTGNEQSAIMSKTAEKIFNLLVLNLRFAAGVTPPQHQSPVTENWA